MRNGWWGGAAIGVHPYLAGLASSVRRSVGITVGADVSMRLLFHAATLTARVGAAYCADRRAAMRVQHTSSDRERKSPPRQGGGFCGASPPRRHRSVRRLQGAIQVGTGRRASATNSTCSGKARMARRCSQSPRARSPSSTKSRPLWQRQSTVGLPEIPPVCSSTPTARERSRRRDRTRSRMSDSGGVLGVISAEKASAHRNWDNGESTHGEQFRFWGLSSWPRR